jgi:hypothetical protein
MLYVNHFLIQRDPKFYGETANEFVPERWLGDTDTTGTRKDEEGSQAGASQIPISAWRPFERGPRNCIGQELAKLEARVILACVMRRYDFVKVGAGEIEVDEESLLIEDQSGKLKTKSELFNVGESSWMRITKLTLCSQRLSRLSHLINVGCGSLCTSRSVSRKLDGALLTDFPITDMIIITCNFRSSARLPFPRPSLHLSRKCSRNAHHCLSETDEHTKFQDSSLAFATIPSWGTRPVLTHEIPRS